MARQVGVSVPADSPAERLVQYAAHLGRCTAALRAFLESQPGESLVVEALGRAALELFDEWWAETEPRLNERAPRISYHVNDDLWERRLRRER